MEEPTIIRSSSEYSDSANTNNDPAFTKKVFSKQIENIVIQSEGNISFIDAVVSLADIYKIDVSECPKFLTPELVEKIKTCAITENKITKRRQKELFFDKRGKAPIAENNALETTFWV